MAFRDRFYTPKVARAVTAPSSIITFGAVAALGVVAAPAALPLAGAALLGAAAGFVAYGAKVLLAVPGGKKRDRIDPFGVNEPWRRFVAEALQARARFDQSLGTMRAGPLQDTLSQIGERLQDAVDESWRIARRGQALADARSQINVETARWELQQVEQRASEPWAVGSTVERTAEALRSQLATVERMDRLLVETVDRLRLLDARMDETVTRAIELAIQADSPDDLGQLGTDVDGLVLDMEALRQALDETSSAGRRGADTIDLSAIEQGSSPAAGTQGIGDGTTSGEGRTQPPTATGGS